MGYRSGFTLVRLLEETRELTTEEEVRRHIDAALAFINSGSDSRGQQYARGKQLVTHLRDASQAAQRLAEEEVGYRLTDFAAYAAGEMPLPYLETLYIPSTRAPDDKHMRAMLEIGVRRSVELLAEFAKRRPDANADEARRWLQDAAHAMDSWTVGGARHGGVKLGRYAHDRLAWLSRIELIVNPTPIMAVSPEIAEKLASIPGAELIAIEVQWRRRKAALERLRSVVEDPNSTEDDIHTELKRQTWIFGGRYVKELARRRLTTFDEIDIPLVRGDGSLHIVELKRANIRNLVERTRSHLAVGPDVHRGMAQAANYLRSLDENRANILVEHGIECRRASATVLIGHPKFLSSPVDPADLAAAFRTYNAELSRIEVITYEDLLDAAERTLAVDDGL